MNHLRSARMDMAANERIVAIKMEILHDVRYMYVKLFSHATKAGIRPDD